MIVCQLGFRERDFWRMTPRKAQALFDKHLSWTHPEIEKKKQEDNVPISKLLGV